MARILHPEWRDEHQANRYPFGQCSRLQNDAGDVILEGQFLDAMLYPVGGQARCYLSLVEVTHDTVTLWIGDPVVKQRASGSFSLVSPSDLIELRDNQGRPAGVIVSESLRLAVFQSWTAGTHAFQPDDTEFADTVCIPTPEIGLRGFQLEDGTILEGDVWLVGDQGIVLSYVEADVAAGPCGATSGIYPVIRVDAIGDPLFRRRLCSPPSAFDSPNFFRELAIRQVIGGDFECGPDGRGDLKITANNAAAEHTVLRVRTTPEGLVIEAAS